MHKGMTQNSDPRLLDRVPGGTWRGWPGLFIIILLGFGALACRIEVGVSQADAASAANNQASIVPGLVTGVPGVEAASYPVAAAPAEIEAAKFGAAPGEETPEIDPGAAPVTPISTPAAPTPVPTPTFTPTPTPTPLPPAQFPPNHILAPAIGLDAPVAVTSWTAVEQGGNQSSAWVVPDDAAGWHANSARPGHGSNVVFSGHHNIGTEVFRDLVYLQPGDPIIVQADGRDYPYTVTDRFILPERGVPGEQQQQNARWILPTVDERITLVTCWPYHDNSHRLIVIAKPAGS